MKYVDLCVTSAEEVKTVFGLNASDEEEALKVLSAEFGIGSVAFTKRQASSASTTNWGAVLLADGQVFASAAHEITIVDRVGAGDSFTGSLIFSLLRGDAPQRAIDFAVAASCLKHTVPGDYNLVSLAEVESLAAGGHGGRVQR
jgi:2-dehydro-3-deoxygluconokinase